MKTKNRAFAVIALLLNLLIVAATGYGLYLSFTTAPNALEMLKYFTIDSNILLGLSALMMIPNNIAKISKPEKPYISFFKNLKFAATIATTITLVVAFAFLGPRDGFIEMTIGGTDIKTMLSSQFFFLHTTAPVLGIISVIFDKDSKAKYKVATLGFIPLFIYAVPYVVFAAASKLSEAFNEKYHGDWYGFLKIGDIIKSNPVANVVVLCTIVVIIMFVAALIFGTILWALSLIGAGTEEKKERVSYSYVGEAPAKEEKVEEQPKEEPVQEEKVSEPAPIVEPVEETPVEEEKTEEAPVEETPVEEEQPAMAEEEVTEKPVEETQPEDIEEVQPEETPVEEPTEEQVEEAPAEEPVEETEPTETKEERPVEEKKVWPFQKKKEKKGFAKKAEEDKAKDSSEEKPAEKKPAPKKAPAKKAAPAKKSPAKKTEPSKTTKTTSNKSKPEGGTKVADKKKEAPKKEATKKAAAPAKKAEPKKAAAPAKKAEPKKAAPAKKEAPKKAPAKKEEPAKYKDKARVYHISQHENGYKVKLAGGERAIKTFKTQKEAIDFAKELVKTQGGSYLIHSLDGSIRKG